MSKYISMELQNNTFYRIYLTIITLTLSTFMANAQESNDIPDVPTKYVEVIDEKPELLFFQGFSLAADLFSPGQKMLSDYGGFEAALRLNLKNTYFSPFLNGTIILTDVIFPPVNIIFIILKSILIVLLKI